MATTESTEPVTAAVTAPAKKDKPAAADRDRQYVVVELLEDGTVAVVGTFEAANRDEACWEAVEQKNDLAVRAEAAGKSGKDGPLLAAFSANLWRFEEHALEPVVATKRVKR